MTLQEANLKIDQLKDVICTNGCQHFVLQNFISGFLPGENYITAKKRSTGELVIIPIETAMELEVLYT